MLFLRKIPVLFWFAVATLVIAGGGIWFFSTNSNALNKNSEADSQKPEFVSGSVEGVEEFKIVGRVHIAVGTSGKDYNSNPPTSGNHWGEPAKGGVYENSLPDEQLIHNLEHGFIWISYMPLTQPEEASSGAGLKRGISESDKKTLEEMVKKDDWKMVLAPRDKNESMIAVAAWGRLLKLDNLDLAKIREFIKLYRNRGPEKTPD